MAKKERKYVADRYGREDQPYGYLEGDKLTAFDYEAPGVTAGLGERKKKKKGSTRNLLQRLAEQKFSK